MTTTLRSGSSVAPPSMCLPLARFLRLLILVAATLVATTASASFHLWVITEVYSNASGAVQYVVLQTSAGGQEFLAGHPLTASQGGNSRSFTFASNLPGDTTNRKFLIGSQGFANLGIVTPDYVVPNGFLFLPGGTINFAGVNSLTYSALPSDGIHAIDRNGNSVATTPTNFAGATGAIVDCLFTWAERTYPQYFAPAGAASITFPPYYYRRYSGTGNYLATSSADNHLWALGPATGNVLLDVGPIGNFLAPAGCSP